MKDELRYDRDENYAVRNQERSSFSLLGIIILGVMLGTLAADAVRIAVAAAWAKHELEQTQKALREIPGVVENMLGGQQSEQAKQTEYSRKLNSDACQFWTKNHEVNPSNKTKAGINQYCP